jgi:drug/metabolite transporter (DMT)-like permease
MDRRLSGLLGLALISGTSFLFIKVAVAEIPPIYLTLDRVALGALVLLAVCACRGESLPRDLRRWGHLTVAAAIGLVVPFTLLGYAERHISSALAGIWNATTPLVVLPLATLVFRTERMTARKAAGLIIGFLGVTAVLGAWHTTGGLAGQLLCLAAAGCYGVAIAYQKRFVALDSARPDSPVATAAAQLLAATVQLGLIAPLVANPPSTMPSPPAALSVIVLGILGTAVGYLLSLHNIRVSGATGAATVTYLIPLVAIAAGTLILGERLAWYQPLGALIVLAGVAVGHEPIAPQQREDALS